MFIIFPVRPRFQSSELSLVSDGRAVPIDRDNRVSTVKSRLSKEQNASSAIGTPVVSGHYINTFYRRTCLGCWATFTGQPRGIEWDNRRSPYGAGRPGRMQISS